MSEEKKRLIYRGLEYPSYYKLEKVMNINRGTIKYRHEKVGIPLDEVPDFKPKPEIERFGKKEYYSNRNVKNNDEMIKNIVDYPRVPNITLSDDKERQKESIDQYTQWLVNAPEALFRRDKRIKEITLKELLEEEQDRFFYATTFHDNEKQKIDLMLKTIDQVAEERGVTFE